MDVVALKELLSRMDVSMSTTKNENRKPLNGKLVSQNFERGRKNVFFLHIFSEIIDLL